MGQILMPGGGGADVSDTTLTPDKALAGYKFIDKDGEEQTGTLQDWNGSYTHS